MNLRRSVRVVIKGGDLAYLCCDLCSGACCIRKCRTYWKDERELFKKERTKDFV